MSKENVYSVSSASILDTPTVSQALTWAVEDHVNFAYGSGYNGVELWPQRIRPLSQIKSGNLSNLEKGGITSVHQSVGMSFKDALKGKAGSGSLRELKKTIFLPGMTESVDYLERTRTLVGKDIPVVLFQDLPEGYLQASGFSQKGIQTSPELCEEIGATNAQEFKEAVLGMGFTNVVIDTHHIRLPSVNTGVENPLRNWQKSFPVLLPYTNEIHVGLGRSDFGNMDKKVVRDELSDFITGGNRNTEVVQMLRSVADSGWRGLIVLELRTSAIKDIIGQKGFLLDTPNYASAVMGMRETLYQIFDQ